MNIKPIHAFEDNLRAATLLLKLYRLLDADGPALSQGSLVDQLRGMVGAKADEDLLVLHHAMLTGVVRQRADMRPADLKRVALSNLLRQAVVSACTALDAFLPDLLRAELPLVISRMGRGFFPTSDGDVKKYFEGVTFDIAEVLGYQERSSYEVGEAIANKLLSAATFRYLGTVGGVHVTACLLQVKQPWDAFAAHLKQDKKSLRSNVEQTTRRRNDIVHRADHLAGPEHGAMPEQQSIEYSQAQSGVAVIDGVCHALDELVQQRRKELEQLPAIVPGGVSPP